jgi:DNA end-binding protein Ku
MAPRSNWKGHLRLSLVSCPIALYPATSEREKVHFHRINRKTGNRLRTQNVDEETGKVVDKEDVGRGYEVGKGRYVEVSDEELDAVQVESTRIIDIDQFVPAAEIDQLYDVRPYYIAPEGKIGQEAFAVIREAIAKEGMVALGRVVLTNREHVIAIEPRGKGLMGTLLRYPYEVRSEKEFFDDIPDEKITKDMLELATHIVRSKAGHFHPEKFEDNYEAGLRELLKRKQAGEEIKPVKHSEPAKVINLMDALRKSLEASGADTTKKPPAPSARQRPRKKPGRSTSRARKAS